MSQNGSDVHPDFLHRIPQETQKEFLKWCEHSLAQQTSFHNNQQPAVDVCSKFMVVYKWLQIREDGVVRSPFRGMPQPLNSGYNELTCCMCERGLHFFESLEDALRYMYSYRDVVDGFCGNAMTGDRPLKLSNIIVEAIVVGNYRRGTGSLRKSVGGTLWLSQPKAVGGALWLSQHIAWSDKDKPPDMLTSDYIESFIVKL